jgi:two-component sensor histidine kinase
LRLINDELKHRVKNTISVVSAIASQTLRGKGQDAALDAFHARLMAFGRAHDILTATSRTTAPIGEVVNDALTPYRTGSGRFLLSGPDILLGSQQALSLSLAIHELATNAAKYGALSREGGHVDVVWRVDEVRGEPYFQFLWEETGGPPVRPPEKTGFGSQLIKRVLAGDFGGRVELSYEPPGFVCLLSAPQAKCCPPAYSSEDPKPRQS